MKRWVSSIAVLAAVAAIGSGQGDVRVQTGNVLDANPQVGSGGRNEASAAGQPINSQLYVTGQVTGLAGFRGSVGYRAANELRLDLPGQSVRSFRGRSVGLRGAVEGTGYRTQPYLDRAQTAMGLRGITSGAAAPGTNVPAHSTLNRQVANELFGKATQSYKQILRTPSRVVSTAMPSVGAEPLAPGWISTAAVRTPDRFEEMDRPGDTALFQLASYDDRQELIRQLRLRRDDEDEEVDEDDRRLDTRVDTRIDPSVAPEAPLRPEADVPDDGGDRQMPKPGEDAFHDLLMALRERQLAARKAESSRKDEDVFEPTDEDAEADEDGKDLIIIRALGGRHRDHFNRFMIEGGRLLKAGRYYAAADKYRAAVVVNPHNPMARIGSALALFGAGESFSAGFHLRRAMELFPPLMETRLDIAGMVEMKAFTKRLEELKEVLAEQAGAYDNPVTLLLGAYLCASVDQQQDARRYAYRLGAASGGNPIYSAYSEFLITGKRPDQPDDKAEDAPAKD
ncbi:MAG: tetratricopeptide repeat protein [Planctomycetota bacterium]|jgi:tetratricopeptide (TPR) repeat protein